MGNWNSKHHSHLHTMGPYRSCRDESSACLGSNDRLKQVEHRSGSFVFPRNGFSAYCDTRRNVLVFFKSPISEVSVIYSYVLFVSSSFPVPMVGAIRFEICSSLCPYGHNIGEAATFQSV